MLFRKSFLLFHFRIFCISQQAQQTFAEKKNFMFFLHRHRRQGDKTFPLSMTGPRAENEWRRRGERLLPVSGIRKTAEIQTAGEDGEKIPYFRLSSSSALKHGVSSFSVPGGCPGESLRSRMDANHMRPDFQTPDGRINCIADFLQRLLPLGIRSFVNPELCHRIRKCGGNILHSAAGGKGVLQHGNDGILQSRGVRPRQGKCHNEDFMQISTLPAFFRRAAGRENQNAAAERKQQKWICKSKIQAPKNISHLPFSGFRDTKFCSSAPKSSRMINGRFSSRNAFLLPPKDSRSGRLLE